MESDCALCVVRAEAEEKVDVLKITIETVLSVTNELRAKTQLTT